LIETGDRRRETGDERQETKDKKQKINQEENSSPTMKKKILRHQDLIVYKRSIELAMRIFEISKAFPREETYSLTDQVRRSSRSVAANLAEAWRKRRYAAAFVSKLNDAEGEAAETQTWIEIAVKCGYVVRQKARELYKEYDEVIAMLVSMENAPESWVLFKRKA